MRLIRDGEKGEEGMEVGEEGEYIYTNKTTKTTIYRRVSGTEQEHQLPLESQS